jgi:hypothetical protein
MGAVQEVASHDAVSREMMAPARWPTGSRQEKLVLFFMEGVRRTGSIGGIIQKVDQLF